jgi:PAS domain S-box-containing protein
MDATLRSDDQLDFRQLANNLPEIVWTATPDGLADFANAEFYTFTGLPASMPATEATYAATHRDDIGPARQLFADALLAGTRYENEIRLRSAESRYHWFLIRAKPLRNEHGAVVRWVATLIDITERKQSELLQVFLLEVAEKIRRAENDEQLLGDMAQAIGRQLGLARCSFDDVDLKSGKARVHTDFYAAGLTPGAREWRIDSFSPTNLDFMMTGRVIVVNNAATDVRTAALYDSLYRPAGYISYVSIPLMREGRWVGSLWANKEEPYDWPAHEIALLGEIAERTWLAVERLRNESALRASEARLRQATAVAGMYSWEIDLGQRRMTWGPNAPQVLDLPPAMLPEAVDQAHIFIHPDDLESTRRIFRTALADGSDSFVQVYRMVNPVTGKSGWLQTHGSIVRDGAGRAVRVFGVTQDITEQKSFELVLEQRVEERTEQLRVINEQLARSNSELEQFAYIASHDLQEPLRKVRTFTGLLRHQAGGTLTPEQQAHLDKIAESTNRMQHLIEDVLDYSRLGRAEARFEPTSLDDVLQQVLADFELTIAEKQAIVTCDPLPTLPAHPLQMNQLFINLVGNGLKFVRPGEPPRLHVGCRRLAPEEAQRHELPPETAYCELSFRDHGIGFRQEYAEKIFSIFQRLHGRHDYAGTGIGLALCRKIVVNHRGKIFAESTEGEGAVFYVILPVS